MTIANIPIMVDLPAAVAEQLEEAANRQQRPVRDLVRDLILDNWPTQPPLPEVIEAELAAFHSLSNEVLWLVARTPLTPEVQSELALLNDEAQSRLLTAEEELRREALLTSYDQIMVRRAQAAVILQSRGYDLSDPAILLQP